MGDDEAQWQAFVAEMENKAREMNASTEFIERMMALISAPTPSQPGLLTGPLGNLAAGGSLPSTVHTGRVSERQSRDNLASHRSHYEKVPNDIPIEVFPYGKPGANWKAYAGRFQKALKNVTNAANQERLDELSLLWIQLKLPEEALPLYNGCPSKDLDWNKLVEELEEAFEDPLIRRNWVRDLGAYKKPVGMSLQVYKANVTGFVNKYSPALADDPKSYKLELYNRFVHGLEPDWRDEIDRTIPYGKETIERAYNIAIKYELKLKSKQETFTSAAMYQHRESSSESSSSWSEEEENFRAVQEADEDSDEAAVRVRTKIMADAISQAITEGMKGLRVKPKSSGKKKK